MNDISMVSDVAEKHGLTGELIYEHAIAPLLSGQISPEAALEYIMEFARGGWPLVIDENLESLADELARRNYSVATVPKGTTDDEIRRDYARDVFITSDSGDFDLSEVPGTFRRGLILVPNGVHARRLAKAIERLLMNWRKENGAAPVKARIERGDLK